VNAEQVRAFIARHKIQIRIEPALSPKRKTPNGRGMRGPDKKPRKRPKSRWRYVGRSVWEWEPVKGGKRHARRKSKCMPTN
jgi:hypothetical protein